MVHQVPQELQDLQVKLDLLVHQVLQELRDLRVKPDLLVLQVHQFLCQVLITRMLSLHLLQQLVIQHSLSEITQRITR